MDISATRAGVWDRVLASLTTSSLIWFQTRAVKSPKAPCASLCRWVTSPPFLHDRAWDKSKGVPQHMNIINLSAKKTFIFYQDQNETSKWIIHAWFKYYVM